MVVCILDIFLMTISKFDAHHRDLVTSSYYKPCQQYMLAIYNQNMFYSKEFTTTQNHPLAATLVSNCCYKSTTQ